MTQWSGRSLRHYRVGRLIGAGGMGEVYEAEDVQLRRRVALKVRPAAVAERLARFTREARALRGVLVGRKNHYGSHSRRGAEVAAICYTLFESAKLAGVDPHRYVLEATRRATATSGAITLPEDVT